MRYYFICNWKMNPASFGKARSLLNEYNKLFVPNKKERWLDKKVVVCPPFLYFQLFDQYRARSIHLGAQNIFWKSRGNYTGQVSAKMIKDFGSEYVIVGHSELREAGDNEYLIREKIREALKFSITPIICVGYNDYIKETLNILNSFLAEEINRMIFAYEPVEAIGSNNPISPERVEEVIHGMKKLIYRKFRKKLFARLFGLGGRKNLIPHPAILYGGSINLQNYKNYLRVPDLGGFVIGRESLNPVNIKEIALGFDAVEKINI